MAGIGPDVVTPLTVEALHAQIEQERRKRIEEHQQAVARLAAAPEALAATTARPLNIFAEGDSWFDYPFEPDVIDVVQAGGAPPPLILNLAHHGDAAAEMLGVAKRRRIIDNLQNPANGTFDALLFSGGGNDIAGDQFCLWIVQNTGGIDPTYGFDRQRLADILGVVEAAYVDLVQIRDQYAPHCAIFVHAYDFAQPTGQGVCGLGPWLKPSLDLRGWTKFPEAAQIVKEVLQAVDKLLTRFEQQHTNVVYVRTQGTLSAGSDWANELHPTGQGFGKIGAVFLKALRANFKGRI
ncbi:MAG TPA: SGNH/GDSL hydrolase family protein [Xanthobacteraceae bacterium]|nr:SGNH/GDSL hydrolase family protein [Xanthobacteraceae bacterium]